MNPFRSENASGSLALISWVCHERVWGYVWTATGNYWCLWCTIALRKWDKYCSTCAGLRHQGITEDKGGHQSADLRVLFRQTFLSFLRIVTSHVATSQHHVTVAFALELWCGTASVMSFASILESVSKCAHTPSPRNHLASKHGE